MEKILEKIVEADRAAREKVNSHRRRFDAINDEIASAEEEIDKALQEKAESAIKRTQEQTYEKKKSETERIDKYFEATKEKLNRSYDENQDRWVGEIFAEVTK